MKLYGEQETMTIACEKKINKWMKHKNIETVRWISKKKGFFYCYCSKVTISSTIGRLETAWAPICLSGCLQVCRSTRLLAKWNGQTQTTTVWTTKTWKWTLGRNCPLLGKRGTILCSSLIYSYWLPPAIYAEICYRKYQCDNNTQIIIKTILCFF